MGKSIDIRFTYTGVKELDRILTNIPLVATHEILGKANFQSAKFLVDKAKGTAPEGPTGNLVDSIGAVKTSIRKADALGEVIVGPRVRKPYRGFHGHLNEFGTEPRETTGAKSLPAGLNRGIMKAKPWFRPAFEAVRSVMDSVRLANISKEILRQMKKYAVK